MIRNIRVWRLIEQALDEDVGPGDDTTLAILNGSESGIAETIAKEDMIIAGMDIFAQVFKCVDSELCFSSQFSDGHAVKTGDIVARIEGSMSSILIAERTALNFFQRMCGIATLTRRYVDALAGTQTKILDTRKTLPCHRDLDKYAVRVGGGTNHRFGLFGGAMIKDNHITAAGGISEAVRMVAQTIPPTLKIEVEVKNLDEVSEALSAGADIIMLDHMSCSDMKTAVDLIDGRALIEASGNVTLANVTETAATGVDFISVGAITHSAPAADLSLNIIES